MKDYHKRDMNEKHNPPLCLVDAAAWIKVLKTSETSNEQNGLVSKLLKPNTNENFVSNSLQKFVKPPNKPQMFLLLSGGVSSTSLYWKWLTMPSKIPTKSIFVENACGNQFQQYRKTTVLKLLVESKGTYGDPLIFEQDSPLFSINESHLLNKLKTKPMRLLALLSLIHCHLLEKKLEDKTVILGWGNVLEYKHVLENWSGLCQKHKTKIVFRHWVPFVDMDHIVFTLAEAEQISNRVHQLCQTKFGVLGCGPCLPEFITNTITSCSSPSQLKNKENFLPFSLMCSKCESCLPIFQSFSRLSKTIPSIGIGIPETQSKINFEYFAEKGDIQPEKSFRTYNHLIQHLVPEEPKIQKQAIQLESQESSDDSDNFFLNSDDENEDDESDEDKASGKDDKSDSDVDNEGEDIEPENPENQEEELDEEIIQEDQLEELDEEDFDIDDWDDDDDGGHKKRKF